MMDQLIRDLRFSLRMLRNRPVFTLIAVLTLALGIGTSTAIFSVVNAVLLRPLDFREPDKLVAVWETNQERGISRFRVTPGTFMDWRARSRSFESMAAFGYASANLTGTGEPELLTGARVSDGYFSTLGVSPQLGRVFLPGEHAPGQNQVVIISRELWHQKFNGAHSVIGRSITLDGNKFQLIGVMPPGIYPVQPTTAARIPFNESRQQFWLPMTLGSQSANNRRSHVLGAIGRLKPGIGLEAAQREMNGVAERLAGEHAENRGEGILLNPLMNEIVGDVRPSLIVLLCAVAVVLLISCANIASLMLAEIVARRKEIAIRSALGATRLRLISQFLTEGIILAAAGGALGIWLASFGIELIFAIIPAEIPRLNNVAIDRQVLAFTLSISALTSILVSLLPAWQGSKTDVQAALKDGSQTVTAGRQFFRRGLVIAQLSLAFALVICSGLLVKSFMRLSRVELGFNPERVLTMSLALPQSKYRDWPQINAFYDRLIERVGSLPGVRSAAIAYDSPLESNWIDSFVIEGKPRGEESLSADLHIVGPEYFRTTQISLLEGRHFSEADNPEHPGVAIINQSFANRYFPNERPIGYRLSAGTPGRMWGEKIPGTFEIVGIVKDVKAHGIASAAEPAFYLPASQFPQPDMDLLVAASVDPLSMSGAVQREIRALDPELPVINVTTMEKQLSKAIAQPRFNMLLVGLFGILALALASIGIYGLLANVVSQRTHEIGIRMALGARAEDVLKMIIGQGMWLFVVSLVIGVVVSLAVGRFMRGLLFDVSAADPQVFLSVGALLGAVSLAACYLPARRALRVDPMTALRAE